MTEKQLKDLQQFLSAHGEKTRVAEKAKLTRQQLSKIANGKVKNPNPLSLIAIAEALGLNKDYFLDPEDNVRVIGRRVSLDFDAKDLTAEELLLGKDRLVREWSNFLHDIEIRRGTR